MIAALDIGATKVCCFIAMRDEAGQIRVAVRELPIARPSPCLTSDFTSGHAHGTVADRCRTPHTLPTSRSRNN